MAQKLPNTWRITHWPSGSRQLVTYIVGPTTFKLQVSLKVVVFKFF